MPVYALLTARNGQKLHEIKDGEDTPTTGKELVALGVLPPPRVGDRIAGQMFSRDTMEEFAFELFAYPKFDRPILGQDWHQWSVFDWSGGGMQTGISQQQCKSCWA